MSPHALLGLTLLAMVVDLIPMLVLGIVLVSTDNVTLVRILRPIVFASLGILIILVFVLMWIISMIVP